MSFEDQPRCGAPSTSRHNENIEKVHQVVLADCCQTNDEISEVTDVSRSSYQHILMGDLMTKRVAAKFVSCCDLQEELKDDPQFLTKVVIGDESWCYGYDRKSEQQSSQWKSTDSSTPKIVQHVHSSFKTMLIFFL